MATKCECTTVCNSECQYSHTYMNASMPTHIFTHRFCRPVNLNEAAERQLCGRRLNSNLRVAMAQNAQCSPGYRWSWHFHHNSASETLHYPESTYLGWYDKCQADLGFLSAGTAVRGNNTRRSSTSMETDGAIDYPSMFQIMTDHFR